jgi:hypothetical protein
MSRIQNKWISVVLASLALLGTTQAFAVTEPHREGYVLDARYAHNRYYPPRGHSVSALPIGYTVVSRGRVPYYSYGSAYYRAYGPRFVVVAPPVGLAVPVLPPFYTTLWVRGVPYYYADDTYYTWRPDRQSYVVTPPPDNDVAKQTSGTDELFIYPKDGQSEQQQATDRYDCHSWAQSQTGFVPTQPPAGGGAAQSQAKRSDYERAMTACLEARGYSVK